MNVSNARPQEQMRACPLTLALRILRRLPLILLLLLGVAPAQPSAAPASAAGYEQRIALVIGNGGYRHVPPLTNPPSDARLTADTLKSLGFRLIGDEVLLNADRVAMEHAIRDFGKRLRGGAVGLFYYAGHGVQIEGENYLVPVGADVEDAADIKYELVNVGYVLDEMKNAGNRLNILILDACRNNPFGGRGLRALSRGLAQMQAPEGTIISYATQPGNTASDGTGKNSPFTRALTTAMMKPGLGIFDTFNNVGLAVKAATGGQQQPWLASSPIEGNFQFLAASAVAVSGEYANPKPPVVIPPASLAENALPAFMSPAPHSATTVAPGTFGGYATSSLSPGTQLRGRMVLKSNGDFEYRGDNGVKISGNMDLSSPENVTGTGTVTQPRILGVPLMRYPDGSTSTQMTLRGKIVNGKLQGLYTNPFEKGEFVFDLGNRL